MLFIEVNYCHTLLTLCKEYKKWLYPRKNNLIKCHLEWNQYLNMKCSARLGPTRRCGPLRGPSSSSCGGLHPSAEAFFALWAKKNSALHRKRLWPYDGYIIWITVNKYVAPFTYLSREQLSMLFMLQERKRIYTFLCKNKPAAQAAGQTLPRWSSTNRPNPPLQWNCRNFWTTEGILMPFGI